MIQDLNNINIGDLNLCVVSFGGSASNTLVNALHENGFNTKNKIWEKILCHCPEYVNLGIPIIYLYTDPRSAFMSMKRRGSGIWDVNQKKLSNNNNVKLSDDNLLQLMIKQFDSWTGTKRNDVLILHTNELFQPDIVDKLEKFLNKKVKGFPLQFKNPKTDYSKCTYFVDLFERHKDGIERVNNLKNEK